MSTINPSHAVKAPDGEPIPPLEDGQRLTRDEFERRYQAMPNLKKAELIDGVVYMPSPVRMTDHGNSHFRIITWLGVYEAATPGILGGDNTSARLDLRNEPQPDVLLMIRPECGGQAYVDEDGYVQHGPELAVEVAASDVRPTVAARQKMFQGAGVREFLVWRVPEQLLEWYVLRADGYHIIAPEANGWVHSTVFPGLWLDPAALVTGDMPRVLAVVQQGVASREHADFVARLAEEAARRR